MDHALNQHTPDSVLLSLIAPRLVACHEIARLAVLQAATRRGSATGTVVMEMFACAGEATRLHLQDSTSDALLLKKVELAVLSTQVQLNRVPNLQSTEELDAVAVAMGCQLTKISEQIVTPSPAVKACNLWQALGWMIGRALFETAKSTNRSPSTLTTTSLHAHVLALLLGADQLPVGGPLEEWTMDQARSVVAVMGRGAQASNT